MWTPGVSRPAISALLWLFLVFSLSGCMSWRAEPTSPATLLATRKPDIVRVVRTDSSRVILREPTVEKDSLVGTEVSQADDLQGKDRRAIPLSDVAAIQTRQSDPTKNILLGAGILVGTAVTMCLLADELGCNDADIFADAALR
jgi:hypothetical protein